MFGLIFETDKNSEPSPPHPLTAARLHLGAFSERVFCDLSVWSPAQYLDHWRSTARRCVEGASEGLFVSSLSERSMDLWPALRTGDAMRFIMVIAPRRHYRIEGNAVVAVRGSPKIGNRENVSEWIVPLVDLARIASS